MSTEHNPGQMDLSLPSELGYEKVVRDAIASFARCMGFDKDRLDDLKTALGEACINAIEHGNQANPDLRVHVSCIYNGEQLLVDIRDHGLKSPTPSEPPIPIQDKVAGLGPRRRMGLLLISGLTDEAGFIGDTHGGNCFRLIWYCQPSPMHREISAGEPSSS